MTRVAVNPRAAGVKSKIFLAPQWQKGITLRAIFHAHPRFRLQKLKQTCSD
jgi:hypothetical protein